MTQTRLLQLKASAAHQGDNVLIEVVDECLKVKRQMQFLDPTGRDTAKAIDVRHYKKVIATLLTHGAFTGALPITIKAEAIKILQEMDGQGD